MYIFRTIFPFIHMATIHLIYVSALFYRRPPQHVTPPKKIYPATNNVPADSLEIKNKPL